MPATILDHHTAETGSPSRARLASHPAPEVHIVYLRPSRVAQCRSTGPDAEARAWTGLVLWARRHELLAHGCHHRFFGFMPAWPEAQGGGGRGEPITYQAWMTLQDDEIGRAVPDGTVELSVFGGGLYAAERVESSHGRPASQGRQGRHGGDHPSAAEAIARWVDGHPQYEVAWGTPWLAERVVERDERDELLDHPTPPDGRVIAIFVAIQPRAAAPWQPGGDAGLLTP